MRSSLGTLLIEAGVASKKDVKDALAEGQQTGERLGEVIIRKGLATDELIAKLLAEQWQLPYAEADEITVDEVAALRISVSNWSTTEDDVDRSIEAILREATT